MFSFWLIVAFLCLGLEALGIGGFLLGSAVTAFLITSLLCLFPEIPWKWQLAGFASGSLVLTTFCVKFFRRLNKKSDHPQLNQRAAQLIGQVIVLKQDLNDSQHKIQLGDTLWSVKKPPGCLKKGSSVIITGSEGMTLLIDKMD